MKEELSFMAMKISDFHNEDESSNRKMEEKKLEIENNYHEVLEIFDISKTEK